MGETSVDDQPTASTAGRWPAESWILVGSFAILTLVGVVLSTGILGGRLIAVPDGSAGTIQVPLYVYLYATLGALGYVFTKLMADVTEYDERSEVSELIEMGMRIPAAWILAAGFYLLAGTTAGGGTAGGGTAGGGAAGGATAAAQLSATVAFLVGLYVNVAIKSLGSVADRMLGRGRPDE